MVQIRPFGMMCGWALRILKKHSLSTVKEKLANEDDVAYSLRQKPRGGCEAEQWAALKSLVQGVVLSSQHDRWVWDLYGSRTFTVASARLFIDRHTYIPTLRKNKLVPKRLIFLYGGFLYLSSLLEITW